MIQLVDVVKPATPMAAAAALKPCVDANDAALFSPSCTDTLLLNTTCNHRWYMSGSSKGYNPVISAT